MPNRRTVILTSATVSLGALGLLAPSLVGAQERDVPATPAAPSPPPELSADLPGAQWVGTARMRYFTFNVYDAALWVAPGFSASRYAQSAFGLQLSYLRSLDGKAIAERSLTEMRRGTSLSAAQEQRWLAAMQDAFPDVKAGDRITGMHQPGVGARFWFNGTARGLVADAEFSRLFFGIWLAETTSEPRLRTALLAKASP
ncbi:MAG: chalcone isomerase family protein [Pseudomonadota bacterium]